MIFWPQPTLRCIDNYFHVQNFTDKLLTNSEVSLKNGFVIGDEHIR